MSKEKDEMGDPNFGDHDLGGPNLGGRPLNKSLICRKCRQLLPRHKFPDGHDRPCDECEAKRKSVELQILELHAAGISITKIRMSLHVHYRTVKKILDGGGYLRHVKKRERRGNGDRKAPCKKSYTGQWEGNEAVNSAMERDRALVILRDSSTSIAQKREAVAVLRRVGPLRDQSGEPLPWVWFPGNGGSLAGLDAA